MINIVILLISAGCAAVMFVKGSIVIAFTGIIAAICALIFGFNFYEFAASKVGLFGSWSEPLFFLIITGGIFAGLIVLIIKLTSTNGKSIDLGFLPERIGRVVLGLVLGLIASGFILVFLAMLPISATFPYARFETATQTNPNKLLINVDGLVTGLFSKVSDGSLSGQTSFSSENPDFLDQLYLSRLSSSQSSQSSQTTQQGGRGAGGGRGTGGGGNRGTGMPGQGGEMQGRGQGQRGQGQMPGRGQMQGEGQDFVPGQDQMQGRGQGQRGQGQMPGEGFTPGENMMPQNDQMQEASPEGNF